MGEFPPQRTFFLRWTAQFTELKADKPAVRTVVHMHGAKTAPESDGYPEDWIVAGKIFALLLPQPQDAASALVTTDHALGSNRLKCPMPDC